MEREERFGSLLRYRRKELKLTTEELARKAGIDRTYITLIEKRNKLPSPRVMKRITDVLNDDALFVAYLKMKYPPLYKQFMKEDRDLNLETMKLADDLVAARKNKTPEKIPEFTKRLNNTILKTQQSIAKFKKILTKLENIEKIHLKSENARQSKDKSKV